MSAEINYEPRQDHKDSPLYMMLRREINEKYADQPVDFNVAGFEVGQEILGRPLAPGDIVADIGSSSGEPIIRAVAQTETPASVICVEPDEEAAAIFDRLEPEDRQGVAFIRAIGEAIPLRDSSVQGATMHNVIFRAQNAAAMLQEVKRIVEPGGFIAISSNAQGHAHYRHFFERFVAETVMIKNRTEFTVPPPPAEGYYLEDLPRLIKRVGGLAIINELYVSQNTEAVITPGSRLEDYLESIKYSAANTNLPPKHRADWRRVVEEDVEPYIEHLMGMSDKRYTLPDGTRTPYFADPIKRGMFALRNMKSF